MDEANAASDLEFFDAVRRERLAHPELSSDYVPEWATPQRRETPMNELLVAQSKARDELKAKHDAERKQAKVKQGEDRDALKAVQLEEMRVAKEAAAAAE